jgi:hypothetical protein
MDGRDAGVGAAVPDQTLRVAVLGRNELRSYSEAFDDISGVVIDSILKRCLTTIISRVRSSSSLNTEGCPPSKTRYDVRIRKGTFNADPIFAAPREPTAADHA